MFGGGSADIIGELRCSTDAGYCRNIRTSGPRYKAGGGGVPARLSNWPSLAINLIREVRGNLDGALNLPLGEFG